MSVPVALVAAALGMTAPDLNGAMSFDDYPQWALQQDASTAALIDVMSNPQGRVERCTLVKGYGNTKLAASVCPIISKRPVHPARLPNGAPGYGVVRSVMLFVLPDTASGRELSRIRPAADAMLPVSALPGGVASAQIEVTLLVDEKGQITKCEPSARPEDALLGKAVCVAQSQLAATPQIDRAGRPVSYVTTQRIKLVVTPAK